MAHLPDDPREDNLSESRLEAMTRLSREARTGLEPEPEFEFADREAETAKQMLGPMSRAPQGVAAMPVVAILTVARASYAGLLSVPRHHRGFLLGLLLGGLIFAAALLIAYSMHLGHIPRWLK